ncbi:ph domain-containing protein [Diplodia corticola]|uniref:Ph domain-containing protein n=1 Tax=Diplodia corticola TaxID=236234 RepID=A0A1J9QTC7_9PEZI|nr:ph domain-containing protein [Diplodia corticola]OJD31242.1 ph domain-containing protein [Diplodia corticola]
MADVAPATAPQNIPSHAAAPMRIRTGTPPPPDEATRKGDLGLGVFSPVNQNGSFEFDRVLKSGELLKRTRKTKTWKTVYLVLRPHTLSIYKDRDETRLRHQLSLNEITAVARQRDASKKAKHVFGLFSPSRNYHLAALSDKDAQDWVELIRRESRIDEEEEEMILASPNGSGKGKTFGSRNRSSERKIREQLLSSSSEGEGLARPPSSMRPEDLHSARRTSHTFQYSGNEQASFSDYSDTPVPTGFRESTLSFSQPNDGNAGYESSLSGRPSLGRNVSQVSNAGANPETGSTGKKPDNERVVFQGWLYILKSKGGVRQWKKLWGVLRPKSLGLYKNEDEYSANLIIPFSNILNAVEIDPMSKTKRFCMQLITDQRNYRFCAPNEEDMTQWLGAFKSLLARRKEAEMVRRGGDAQAPAPVPGGPVSGSRVVSGSSATSGLRATLPAR